EGEAAAAAGAGAGGQLARDDAQEGGLAGAVAPDEGRLLAGAGEGDVVEDDLVGGRLPGHGFGEDERRGRWHAGYPAREARRRAEGFSGDGHGTAGKGSLLVVGREEEAVESTPFADPFRWRSDAEGTPQPGDALPERPARLLPGGRLPGRENRLPLRADG